MGWGASREASERFKLKAEMADYLKGLNSTGDISYKTYSELFDVVMESLDKMHEIGMKDKES